METTFVNVTEAMKEKILTTVVVMVRNCLLFFIRIRLHPKIYLSSHFFLKKNVKRRRRDPTFGYILIHFLF